VLKVSVSSGNGNVRRSKIPAAVSTLAGCSSAVGFAEDFVDAFCCAGIDGFAASSSTDVKHK
jgi:hypothetical protein